LNKTFPGRNTPLPQKPQEGKKGEMRKKGRKKGPIPPNVGTREKIKPQGTFNKELRKKIGKFT